MRKIQVLKHTICDRQFASLKQVYCIKILPPISKQMTLFFYIVCSHYSITEDDPVRYFQHSWKIKRDKEAFIIVDLGGLQKCGRSLKKEPLGNSFYVVGLGVKLGSCGVPGLKKAWHTCKKNVGDLFLEL